MVNIKNSEIKLLNELLKEYFNHQYSTENYFKYQDVLVSLNFRMESKKLLNKEQYEDRIFWKNYNKLQVNK